TKYTRGAALRLPSSWRISIKGILNQSAADGVMTQVPPPRADRALPAQLEKATVAHKQGRLSEAEGHYSAILVEHPHNFDALHRLGLLKYQQGELNLARGLIERAIAVNPASGAAWSNLGSIFLAMRRHEEALMGYDKAIALLPDEVYLHFNRGNA